MNRTPGPDPDDFGFSDDLADEFDRITQGLKGEFRAKVLFRLRLLPVVFLLGVLLTGVLGIIFPPAGLAVFLLTVFALSRLLDSFFP